MRQEEKKLEEYNAFIEKSNNQPPSENTQENTVNRTSQDIQAKRINDIDDMKDKKMVIEIVNSPIFLNQINNAEDTINEINLNAESNKPKNINKKQGQPKEVDSKIQKIENAANKRDLRAIYENLLIICGAAENKKNCLKNKIWQKLIKYEFVAKTNLSIINMIALINQRAQNSLGFNSDPIELGSIKVISILNRDNSNVSQDQTLSEFLQNYFGISNKILDDIVQKEKENKEEKIKLIYLLFSQKLSQIHQIYLDSNPFLKIDEVKLLLKPYQNFKDQFKELNNEKILQNQNQIIEALKNELDKKNKEYILHDINIDSKILIESLTKAITKIQSELDNMITNEGENKLNINNFLKKMRKIMKIFIKSLNDYFLWQMEKFNDKPISKIAKKISEFKTFDDCKNFLNKCISEIYEDFFKSKRRNKNYTLNQIDKAIKNEEKKEKPNERKLFKIFNYSYFRDFFYAFIEDKDYIIIKDGKNNSYEYLRIDGFKTFRDYVSEIFSE